MKLLLALLFPILASADPASSLAGTTNDTKQIPSALMDESFFCRGC